jgi:3-keto-5-aminohexanoate cleavage enzyme
MVTVKEVFEGFKTALDTEPPLMTMKKKLIINIAPTGSFTSKQQNPQQPVTQDEIVAAVTDSYRAGASVWHVHTRDKDGYPSKDPKVFKETIDRVLERCPDIITSVIPYANFDSQGVEQIKPIVDYLVEAGPQYMRTAVLFITTTAYSDKFAYIVTQPILSGIVRYLDERGIKGEFQGHSYSAIKDVCDWIVQPGIARKPHLFNEMAGFHGFSHASPIAPDPWSYVYLMTMQQTLPPSSVAGVCAGGRNWLPFTTMAILLGFDSVRIGMEDAVYMYPHSGEKIAGCGDVVRKVANVARELGREIATPSEARQVMGL